MLIKIYATLRELVGESRLNVPAADAPTVGEVLKTLAQANPELDKKLWDANGNLTGFVTVLLNGRSVAYLNGLTTPVSDADVLALFPPVGGG